MSEFFYVICGSFVLVILLFFTDLQLTKVGKGIVFCISIGLGELCQFLSSTYNLYESLAICLVFMLAGSYLIQSKLHHIIFLPKQQFSKLIKEDNGSNRHLTRNHDLTQDQDNVFFENSMKDESIIEELFKQDDKRIRNETVL
jgi:hypothetical protein